ncbi:MAG: carboxypeptidase-like regulatory domain-containing protein [Parafilimonas sp.]
MKSLRCIILSFLLCSSIHAQFISAKVIDSSNNNPLAFATIIYAYKSSVTYSDEDGFFYLPKDSLYGKDSIIVQYLGYYDLIAPAINIRNSAVFKMQQRSDTLAPVVVSNCKKTKDYTINKQKNKIHHFRGPGPETKFVIIAKYNNRITKSGYVNKISIYIDKTSSQFKVPLRFRWYEWDDATQRPGKELTDKSLIVYPYTDGWNDFNITTKSIRCKAEYIVFGLEFIYPSEFIIQYANLKTVDEKIQWLRNLQNRWSLDLFRTKERTERSFYIINNATLKDYPLYNSKYYEQPAVIFTIKACEE